MIALGVDPDTHDTSWAVLDDREKGVGQIVQVGCVSVPRRLSGQEAVLAMMLAIKERLTHELVFCPRPVGIVVVEGQRIYPKRAGGPNIQPNSVLSVGQVAGCVVGSLLIGKHVDMPLWRFPLPQEWKGSVPKRIHQSRILGDICAYERSGGKSDSNGYCIPTEPIRNGIPGARDVKKGQWKHITDAIGLAKWGLRTKRR